MGQKGNPYNINVVRQNRQIQMNGIKMNDLAIWLPAINLFIIIIGGLLIYKYLPAYFVQKGKNLATKEDVEIITEKVEKIRSQYSADIERLKATLDSESALLQKRRQIYEEIVSSLRIFLSGHESGPNEKNKFLNAYATAWLWAPDSVVTALGYFLELQIKYAKVPGSVKQDQLKDAYSTCVVEMRKDVGFPGTGITSGEYKFVYF
ncbi:MAG: hypothetical protein HGB26_07640 [Desulfobulbaceae bacterium]|nr:hypothetical protein [Desulfobulbaceae bacterium]